MGCCSSREADNSGRPYAGNNQNNAPESARNIIAPSARASNASNSQPPKADPPNQALKPIDPRRRAKLPDPYTFPTSTAWQNPGETPWTRMKLEQERNDWWGSRTTGRKEIWAAYKSMVEHLQKGEVLEAQTLLAATECTCPTGKLWHSIYDERGVEYGITEGSNRHEWLIFEPTGLVEADPHSPDAGLEDEDDDFKEPSTQAKGKRRADDMRRVKCRLSTTAKDYYIDMPKDERIGYLMRELSKVTGLPSKRHRVSFLGKVFSPDETLPTEGPRAFKDGCILTILVMPQV